MTEIVSVYATFPSEEEAKRIGRALVEERLAACVNILGPCHSIYRWQGRVEEASEVAAVFKTNTGNANALVDGIATLHSYGVPAVVVWPVEHTTRAYESWVLAETS